MRELPSKAVRENTDRQTSSSGCKIRVKWKTEKGFLPVPTYATLYQRLPVAKNYGAGMQANTLFCMCIYPNDLSSAGICK